MRSRRFYLFAGFLMVSCLGMQSGCNLADLSALIPGTGQREIDFFNDSTAPAHLMVFGEVRSPSNLVQPGDGRIATIRFMPGDVLTVRAESAQGGFLSLGTCTYTERTDNVQGGEISFTGSTFVCSGPLFE